ncbi:MAG: twin-arginine translocase subunit TatC [Bacteroidales bacterium]|nr:twin-arginine translocase subunit TatC [Bacteroidales bacterium]
MTELKKKKARKKRNRRRKNKNDGMMTFGGHLEVLRRMLFRIIIVVFIISGVIFYFKDKTFELLLAPSEWNFITYRYIERFMHIFGSNFHFNEFHVNLIATELSSQFMTHITTSLYLGLLGASPYILIELFNFITPALYDNEKKYSVRVAITIYLLFVLGVLMSYFILFPISFRFLGTYSVSDVVESNITLKSYTSTFTTLTLVMGLVFQLPVIAFFLGKLGVVTSEMMKRYRKYAFLVIMIVAAIITPPDVMTLILVTIPLYLLYEISRIVIKRIEKKKKKHSN